VGGADALASLHQACKTD